jgi:signal transduction histidine kinase
LIERLLRKGEPLLVPEVTSEWLRRNAGTEAQLEEIRRLAPRSLMVVPLRGRERILGTICFCLTQTARGYDAHDLALAQQLAARAALAVENARLFQQSREATRLRDEVLRVVAHDLRNPLNTISLSAGLLDEQMSPVERTAYGDKLDLIARSVARADRLIQDLLDVARMQAGRLTIDVQPVAAADLVEEAIRMHQPLAAERNITLRGEVSGKLGTVSADRHRLQQVLANLIGNALKFTHEGGHVTVRASAQEDAVQFAIHDDGPGIQAADMPRLFDPFWQARKGGGGAGLGLPICRGIVEAHHGRIWTESEPGKGSTFYFTVPLDPSRAEGRSLAAD